MKTTHHLLSQSLKTPSGSYAKIYLMYTKHSGKVGNYNILIVPVVSRTQGVGYVIEEYDYSVQLRKPLFEAPRQGIKSLERAKAIINANTQQWLAEFETIAKAEAV